MAKDEDTLEDREGERQGEDDGDLLASIARGVRTTLRVQQFLLSQRVGDPVSAPADMTRIAAELYAACGAAIDDLDLTMQAVEQVRADEAQIPLAPWTDDLEPDSRRALATAVGRLLYWRDADGFKGVAPLADAMAFVCAENRPAIGGEVPAAATVFKLFLDDCEAVEKGYPGEGVALMRSAIRGLAIVIAAQRGGRLAGWFRALEHFARMNAENPPGR